MKFNYQARTKTGEIQIGAIEASDRDTAFTILKSHGLYVTALESAAMPFYARHLEIFKRAKRKDIVLFSRQLAIMFKSRVPVVETFRTIAKQTKKTDFREKILKIAEEVEGGSSLSQAFSLYPKLFSTFYISMVRSGEASGKLTDVFNYLADYLEKEQQFRSGIKAAMIYPAFILLVFVGVVLLIMLFIIPSLAEVLKETGQELPVITKVVIAISDFLRSKKGILIFLPFPFLIIIIYKLLKSKSGKKFFDRNLIKIPLLNSFLKKLYLARFALNLSTLISGGLPITQALQITGEVVNNDLYQKIIFETREEVKRGETISSVLEKYPRLIFPLFYQMVVVGEKTGTLDESLLNVVEFYQREVDQALNSFIRLLEPIFIIILGGMVALLMASVVMPLYSMGIT